ncbi:YfdX family protein [Methylorubrum populi]|uniref:YfdX family protein n=1 Tax=Methylorubrum TaxID=2282523 RepID=UPI001150F1B0|nr:YfdX family protein [Methylorubrum populi]
MTYRKSLAAALVATTVLGSAAFAADQATKPAVTQEAAARQAVDKDVGKLSKDGAQAFRDMHLARVAIYDAAPNQAKDYIGKAKAALSTAKSDDAVFNKAEADLKSPADMTKAGHATATSANKGSSDKASSASEQTAWLPVDAQLTLGEDFQATPAKASAVTEANKSLMKGDKKAALEKLKLADVDVNFVMAVLPLNKTTADVDQAATLIDQGKYYEANAVLKKAEDRMRFDVIDAVGVPQKAAAHATDAKTASHKANASQETRSTN